MLVVRNQIEQFVRAFRVLIPLLNNIMELIYLQRQIYQNSRIKYNQYYVILIKLQNRKLHNYRISFVQLRKMKI